MIFAVLLAPLTRLMALLNNKVDGGNFGLRAWYFILIYFTPFDLSNGTSVSDFEWPWRSFVGAIHRTFVHILPHFNWQRAHAVPQRQLGFLSSSVKLHCYGRRTISGKLLAIGFAATIRLLSNYFDLLFTDVVYTTMDIEPTPVQGAVSVARGCRCR